MILWKNFVLFYLGGTAYMTMEFAWRGRSHGSMFLLGGLCFCVLGKLGKRPLPITIKTAIGAVVVTGLELVTGMALNWDHKIWDYRRIPLNFRGQICLPYSLLWLPMSLAAFVLYDWAERTIVALTFPEKRVK